MSRTAEAPDHVEPPVADRPVSSIGLIIDATKAAAEAWARCDEREARTALQTLVVEATLLSKMHPLPLPDRQRRRMQIASERESSGRGSS